MSLKGELVTISHEDGDDIEILVPGSKLIFKSSARDAMEPGGTLEFVASEGIDAVAPYLIEQSEFGKFTKIFSCKWPCYDNVAQTVLSVSVTAGIFMVDEECASQWNLLSDNGLIAFLISDFDAAERSVAQAFDKDFEEYCQDNYFAKQESDFSDVSCGNIKWKHSVSGSLSMDLESARFNLALPPKSVLYVSFSVSMLRDGYEDAPDLNEFKQHLVTEYLKHIRIEPEV